MMCICFAAVGSGYGVRPGICAETDAPTAYILKVRSLSTPPPECRPTSRREGTRARDRRGRNRAAAQPWACTTLSTRTASGARSVIRSRFSLEHLHGVHKAAVASATVDAGRSTRRFSSRLRTAKSGASTSPRLIRPQAPRDLSEGRMNIHQRSSVQRHTRSQANAQQRLP